MRVLPERLVDARPDGHDCQPQNRREEPGHPRRASVLCREPAILARQIDVESGGEVDLLWQKRRVAHVACAVDRIKPEEDGRLVQGCRFLLHLTHESTPFGRSPAALTSRAAS
eukprot:6181120-Pleurochrysis_carterae.AAC.2